MTMDHRRYAGFPNQPEAALCQILQEAQHRWLRPTEVCEILRNYRKFKLTPDPPHKPQSGSLFLFDRKALRYFRKDGHNWRKKKDGKTVREAHERLKAGSVEVLHCYYAHGEENENFQRRSYWMLDTHEHIVLVHYREVKEGNRSGMRSPNSYSVDGGSVGNSRGVVTSSPQTSPLVSPRASSPNSADWNGRTHSPENDEPESSDDTDQYRLQELEHNGIIRSAGAAMANARHLQSSASFSTANQNGANYVKQQAHPHSTFPNVNGTSAINNMMQTAEGLPLKQDNRTLIPPGGVDLLEFAELIKQGKHWEGHGNGRFREQRAGALSDWSNAFQQHQDGQSTMIIPGPYGQRDPKLSMNEPSLFNILDAHPRQSFAQGLTEAESIQGLPEIINRQDSTGVQWSAVLEHFTDTGGLQNGTLGNELLNTTQDTQPQFSQTFQGSEQLFPFQQELVRLDGLENKDLPQYSHVFRDFQADTPSQREEQETFKKLDSFNRWISEEIGADAENPLLSAPSDSETYWANALEDHNGIEMSNLAQQMQLDGGLLPFLQHDQYFTISDFSPNTATCTVESKVLVIGNFTNAVKDPSECNWACMFGDIEVPAELLQSGVLRCKAPPHAPGKVHFYVTRSDRVPCSDIHEFEYHAEVSAPEVSGEGLERAPLNKRDMLFQIRLACMLSPTSSCSSCSCDETSQLITYLNSLNVYEEWEQMEDQLTESGSLSQSLKEQLIQKLLKEKLHLWLRKRALGGGKGASVLDEHGLGVLHMGAALGYTWIIAPTLAAGVNINFRDSRGWTALHWAAHCGREAMVVALLAAGAAPGAKTDPTSKFPDGQTPADLASIERHKGIAGYLAESSLTSHLSSLTLKPNMDGNMPGAHLGELAIETVSERTVVEPSHGQSQDQLSLQDSLAAVRNAAQAAAHIQNAFRVHSFRKKQESLSLQEDEYGISNEEARYIIAAQRPNRSGLSYEADEISQSAAIRIQQKFRGWKGRKEFLLFRQHVVKIQAHFRGHQVRKQYKKILWSVGIVEKAILRWRRKGKGLRGFCAEGATQNGDDDFLKAGRKQIEVGLEKALARVQSMVRSPEAREQYRRLVEGYQKTKSHFEGGSYNTSPNREDLAML